MSGLWGCNVSINTTLCPTNWHHQCRNTPLWNLATTNRKKREHTNTCSDLHCHRISRNMVVASGGAKPPIRVEFKMVVASCVLFTQCSVQHRVRGCAKKKPTSTFTSATICIKTRFTIVQGCSTSSTNNDGESFEHRKRVFPKYAKCARSARALCPMTTCFQRQMS